MTATTPRKAPAASAHAPIGLQNVISFAPRRKARLILGVLCKDRPEVVQAFVTRQMSLGIAHLHLYFDDPQDPSIAWAAAQPDVTAYGCDAAFWERAAWQGKPGRPPHIEARQMACYSDCYRHVPADHWAGYCNIDEIFVPRWHFDGMLNKIEPQYLTTTAPVAEAIWAPGEDGSGFMSATLARCWVPKKHLKNVLQNRSALFAVLTKNGLAGHVWGKSLVRGGLEGVTLGIHHHYRMGPNGRVDLPSVPAPFSVVHYDAPCFEDWRAKHMRRIGRETLIGGNPSRRTAQSDIVALCGDEDAMRRLFLELYGTTPALVAALREAGALREIDSPQAR